MNPLLFSWQIDQKALQLLLPDGLQIDSWHGKTYISLVGLRFESTRVLGIPSPVSSYDEINLRFYVRREMDEGNHRRGVVFVRQMVPHRVTSLMARIVYGEPFTTTPVSHQFSFSGPGGGEHLQRVAYRWGLSGQTHHFWAEIDSRVSHLPEAGSLDEFLTNRYWGYNGKPGTRTRAYQLTRPEWPLLQPCRWDVDHDAGEAYGEPFATVMRDSPASVLLAPGSQAAVGLPTTLAT